MIALTSDRPKFLAERLRRSRDDPITYPEVGFTRACGLPAGYNHDRFTLRVGQGDTAWDRAREAIRLWRAHAHAGITITPAGASISEGTTVIASRGYGPLLLVAPCRVVYASGEPGRFGFAYGTLPGHPERGEEAFHVVLHDDGVVTADIVAFSKPADLTTRAASPLARQIQRAAMRRYLEGIKAHVSGAR